MQPGATDKVDKMSIISLLILFIHNFYYWHMPKQCLTNQIKAKPKHQNKQYMKHAKFLMLALHQNQQKW